MDDRDCAKCQKIKKNDTLRIIGIVNGIRQNVNSVVFSIKTPQNGQNTGGSGSGWEIRFLEREGAPSL